MDIGAPCRQCKGHAVRCDLCHGTGSNDAQPPVMRPEYLDLPPGVSHEAFAAEVAAQSLADDLREARSEPRIAPLPHLRAA